MALVIKLTDSCNLSCGYCYYGKKALPPKRHAGRISAQILEDTIRFACSKKQGVLDFVWHGGEPLLVGIQSFRKILALQKQYGDGRRIRNSLQTNGLLLSDEWIDFLHQHEIQIGISIDGPASIHMAHRRGYTLTAFEKLMGAVKRLNSLGASYGVLTVVGKMSVAEAPTLFDFYVENGIENVAFLPCIEHDESFNCSEINHIKVEEYGVFLCHFFDLWANSTTKIQVRNFDEILRGLLGKQPRHCSFAGACEQHLTVNTDGEIYLCDCLPRSEAFRVGSVVQSHEDISRNENFLRFAAEIRSVPVACRGCVYVGFCRGGCKHHRHLNQTSFSAPSYYCESIKKLTARTQLAIST